MLRLFVCFICMLLFPSILFATDFVKIGVFNDLHFLSDKLHDNGSKVNELTFRTGKNVIASNEVLDAAIEILLKNNIEALLIPGDLTNEGEKESHLQLREKLGVLQNAGIKIFVIPGNHDINNPAAKGYKEETVYKTETITSDDFRSIYQDFGYNTSVSKDPNSLSYIAPINDSIWILALDAAQYNNNSGNQAVGKIHVDSRQWILENLKLARQKNKQVIAMMHWGLLEHMPFQSRFFESYLVTDADNMKKELADAGVQIIFTGHFHAHDINKYTSEAGNTIYDIATGALVSHPYTLRIAELNRDSLKINTEHITAVPSFPKLAANSKQDIIRLAQARSIPLLKKTGLAFTPDDLTTLSWIAGKYFADTFGGDEKLDEEAILQIQEIFNRLGFPISESIRDIELKEQVPDNELSISLK